MHARRPLLTAVLLAIGLQAAAPIHAAEERKGPPNLLVILADDVGWGDAAWYGASRIKTPNIDRLCAEGRMFENGHASASVCTPTRYSLLTGQYSWRRQGRGLDEGVTNSESPLLIPTDMPTLPSLLKSAGYRTAVIGKWHLGFGTRKPDFNQELRPGPLEIGFDSFLGIPSTNDRVPTVLVRDHRVQGLKDGDPILYTHDEAEAKRLGMNAWAAGRNRIGWAKGGKSAWWKDAELAADLTRESLAFIERNQDKPFFLLFTPPLAHPPFTPNPRFAGASGLSARADALLELDACIGEILGVLDRLNLTRDTLVVYTSDNGSHITEDNGHRPNGHFRGNKSQLWEGGLRVPLVVRWPARIKPGISTDLASTLDVPATLCAAANVTLPDQALPDSFNLLPSLVGEASAPARDHLVVMGGNGALAIISGSLKYIPDLAVATGWETGYKAKPTDPDRPGLLDLGKDAGEKANLLPGREADAKRLAELLAKVKASASTRPR